MTKQDILDYFKDINFAYNDCSRYESLERMLDELQTAQSESYWIPVTERLPRLDESVLATTAWNDITIAWRIGINEWYIHEGNTNAETDDLIAWMPLPEPY